MTTLWRRAGSNSILRRGGGLAKSVDCCCTSTTPNTISDGGECGLVFLDPPTSRKYILPNIIAVTVAGMAGSITLGCSELGASVPGYIFPGSGNCAPLSSDNPGFHDPCTVINGTWEIWNAEDCNVLYGRVGGTGYNCDVWWGWTNCNNLATCVNFNRGQVNFIIYVVLSPSPRWGLEINQANNNLGCPGMQNRNHYYTSDAWTLDGDTYQSLGTWPMNLISASGTMCSSSSPSSVTLEIS